MWQLQAKMNHTYNVNPFTRSPFLLLLLLPLWVCASWPASLDLFLTFHFHFSFHLALSFSFLCQPLPSKWRTSDDLESSKITRVICTLIWLNWKCKETLFRLFLFPFFSTPLFSSKNVCMCFARSRHQVQLAVHLCLANWILCSPFYRDGEKARDAEEGCRFHFTHNHWGNRCECECFEPVN